jgi:hypothetical protein
VNGDCGHDYFVAYSCKGRGVRPSCNTRRMVETAAHLTDHVFPRLPVRQWVLSVPKRLRYFMQRDKAALIMVLRIFLQVIAQSLQSNCPGAASVDKAALHIGAVVFIHRFGSMMPSFNPHRRASSSTRPAQRFLGGRRCVHTGARPRRAGAATCGRC